MSWKVDGRDDVDGATEGGLLLSSLAVEEWQECLLCGGKSLLLVERPEHCLGSRKEQVELDELEMSGWNDG